MRISLDEPRYDQSTYWGRARHFFYTVNPLNLFCTSEQLEKAKDIVVRYRRGEDIPGLSEDDIWKAKNIYDSAFHPDTGEKVFIVGRMSAQVPVNMLCNACMLNLNKSHLGLMFCQWINQSFNAIVNYSNRSGDASSGTLQLAITYMFATGGAIAVASLTRSLFKNMKHPMLSRYLPPFVGVCAANLINIPMMRMAELRKGVPVYDVKGNLIGHSVIAAESGIAQVCLSRVITALPVMMFPPLIIDPINKRFQLPTRYPRSQLPLQVFVTGFLLIFATPMCCAIFPQKASIKVSHLEKEIQDNAKRMSGSPNIVYFNKGL